MVGFDTNSRNATTGVPLIPRVLKIDSVSFSKTSIVFLQFDLTEHLNVMESSAHLGGKDNLGLTKGNPPQHR